MDSTTDLISGTSMEVDIQILDEVSATDNSLDCVGFCCRCECDMLYLQ